MMKNKHHQLTTAMAVLLMIGSANAVATPAQPTLVTTLAQWLFTTELQSDPGLGCDRYPDCLPPVAPAPLPLPPVEK